MTKADTKKAQKDQPEAHQQIDAHLDPKLPPICVDNLNVAIREDGISLLRFLTTLPEGSYEQSKLITTTANLKNFIEALCSTLDYYPEKKSQKPAAKKKNG
jgi:hypothetical protein